MSVEQEAEKNLKRVKSAQYEAALAAHKREAEMKTAKALHRRQLQTAIWKDRMAWEASKARLAT